MGHRHPERIYTNTGLMNDIEANLLKVVKIAFESNENLRYDLSYHPKVWMDINPDKISQIEDLPALYVWSDGFKTEVSTLGGMSGNKMTQKIFFLCNVHYMIPLVEDYEGDKKLKEIAWFLFESVSENQNLYDLINGQPEIAEVRTYPDLKIIGEKIIKVSNVNLKVVFPYNRKTVMAIR